jgi:hypothetical protein
VRLAVARVAAPARDGLAVPFAEGGLVTIVLTFVVGVDVVQLQLQLSTTIVNNEECALRTNPLHKLYGKLIHVEVGRSGASRQRSRF